MVSQRVLCRRFIGRVAELGHLADCRRRAGAAHGCGIIVFGDAGIGKSRLVREYRERFGALSVIATGSCREFGQGPLVPLIEVFDQLDRGSPSPLRTQAASKDEQIAAILAAVERAAARRVTTIIIEDIHWAQVELLQTLTALVRWATRRRLLVICTCREGEAVPGTPQFTALARLSREASAVQLEPMASAELSELMLDALDEFGTRLPDATFNDVRRRADGNPFFAEELLRHAVDAQHNAGARRTALPISLQGVIRERLDRCDARERAFLSAASVLGQRFRVDVLTAVFELSRDDAVAALGSLIGLQLIDRCEDPLTYEFRHALARDVVYGDLVPAQAVNLHQRVAEAVAALPAPDEHTELLAHSFWSAGLRERAAPYCEAAGDRAMAQYAYEDAVTWFERAATSLADRVPDVGRVLGKASIALNRLGEPKRAAPLYERAIDAFVAHCDFEAAVRMCTYLGGTLYNDARSDDAFAAFETAGTLAARSGVAALELHVRLRMFSLCVASRNVDRAVAISAAIDESALDPASRDTFEYELAKTTLHALRDERELRSASIARALDALDRRQAPAYERRFAHGYVAVDSLAIGEIEEARRHATLGLEVARSIRSDVAYMLALLADAEERAGELRLARGHLAAIIPSPDFLHRHARSVAAVRVALAAGDDAAVADAYDLELLREAGCGGNTDATLELIGSYAVAAMRLNRDDEARAFAERFARELVSPYGVAWQIVEIARLFPALVPRLHKVVVNSEAMPARPLDAAVSAFLEALVARARGDVDRAQACARAAAGAFQRMGWPAMSATCLETAGDAALALRLYRELGRAIDVRRLEYAASRDGTGTLSPREREVARLIAGGKNNRTAALELAITPKAVEKYLTSIYRKLGLSSRTQLAAYVTANGPGPLGTPETRLPLNTADSPS